MPGNREEPAPHGRFLMQAWCCLRICPASAAGGYSAVVDGALSATQDAGDPNVALRGAINIPLVADRAGSIPLSAISAPMCASSVRSYGLPPRAISGCKWSAACSDNSEISCTGNAGDVRIRGFELDGSVAITPSVRLFGSAAYTDAGFSVDAPEAGITGEQALCCQRPRLCSQARAHTKAALDQWQGAARRDLADGRAHAATAPDCRQ